MPVNKNEILVLASPATSSEMIEGARGLLNRMPAPVVMNVETLKNSLTDFLQSINQLLAGIPTVTAPFKLDEIELSVEVSAEGSIQLVGGVKVGATGGITLKLKR